MTETPLIAWVLFNLLVLALLALDLGVFHRKAHAVKMKEALIWSGVWIALALTFSAFVFAWKGQTAGLEFLAGYLIEKSLSVDNIFVFVLLFGYFQIPDRFQHRVLFWGILGALIMRALFIAAGISLIERFHSAVYIFGALLVFTGVKMWFSKESKMSPERNRVLRFFKRVVPTTENIHDGQFIARENGARRATPLLVVLTLIETTDVIFAADSIPAILAVTRDAFLVYTSNVFAILGLRSLYFALAGMMQKFVLLRYGLAVILGFVGLKMVLVDVYHVPIVASLGVIAVTLTVSILLSLRRSRLASVG